MSRCIGNDARASSLFLTPRLGSSDEPVSNIVGHDIRLLDKFGIGLDGANNFVITNGTTATTPLTIYGDGSGFLFDPPLPGGGSGVNNPMTQDLGVSAYWTFPKSTGPSRRKPFPSPSLGPKRLKSRRWPRPRPTKSRRACSSSRP